MKIESSKYIFEKSPNIKFMKISPLGEKLCYADRHIDIHTGRQTGGPTEDTKLIIAFRNFATAPNKNYNNATACPSLWT
jgi:hypothetical protein